MLNMNERMNESLFNLNYKIINIVRLFNFTRSAILPHNLPKLYSTGRFSWSTICYCAGGRGLKVLNGTRPVEYTQYLQVGIICTQCRKLEIHTKCREQFKFNAQTQVLCQNVIDDYNYLMTKIFVFITIKLEVLLIILHKYNFTCILITNN